MVRYDAIHDFLFITMVKLSKVSLGFKEAIGSNPVLSTALNLCKYKGRFIPAISELGGAKLSFLLG